MSGIHPKLIKADGSWSLVEPENGTDFQLKELQAMLGGYIEIVYPESNSGAILVINEHGRALGLPENALAGMVAGVSIVGPALICNTNQVK